MPTSYKDQFFQIDPYSPPPAGTAVNFVRLTMVDANNDGQVGQYNNDSLDGSDITNSWDGDTVTINVPGVGNVTYRGTTFYLADGRRFFTPNDGQVLQNGTLVTTSWVTTDSPLNVPGELGPTCFTPGVLIDTPAGPRAIETLAVGDEVLTRDHGARPIRWIGRQGVDARGEFAPVRFARGAFGNDAPLLVSPNHRMLVTGWQAELFCGEDEVLVAAKHLVNATSIRFDPRERVDYMHLLFDDHEILSSHGVWSESFFAGAFSRHADRATYCEALYLFPELAGMTSKTCALARPMAKTFEAGLLAA